MQAQRQVQQTKPTMMQIKCLALVAVCALIAGSAALTDEERAAELEAQLAAAKKAAADQSKNAVAVRPCSPRVPRDANASPAALVPRLTSSLCLLGSRYCSGRDNRRPPARPMRRAQRQLEQMSRT